MEDLTSDKKLRLVALQVAVDSLDRVPLPAGATITGRAQWFYEFLIGKDKEANEES